MGSVDEELENIKVKLNFRFISGIVFILELLTLICSILVYIFFHVEKRINGIQGEDLRPQSFIAISV